MSDSGITAERPFAAFVNSTVGLCYTFLISAAAGFLITINNYSEHLELARLAVLLVAIVCVEAIWFRRILLRGNWASMRASSRTCSLSCSGRRRSAWLSTR